MIYYQTNDFFIIVIILLLFSAIIISILKKINTVKGWVGEFIVKIAADAMLNKKTYHKFHNILLQTNDGTTQIDHIFISKFGVFVIETKNMRGWIFGTQSEPMWRQQISQKKYQFQNPLHQNYKHVQIVKNLLKLRESEVISLIIFTGKSIFGTPMPENVTHRFDFIEYIKKQRKILLDEKQVFSAVTLIKSNNISSRKTRKEHINVLKNRYNSTSNNLYNKCKKDTVLKILITIFVLMLTGLIPNQNERIKKEKIVNAIQAEQKRFLEKKLEILKQKTIEDAQKNEKITISEREKKIIPAKQQMQNQKIYDLTNENWKIEENKEKITLDEQEKKIVPVKQQMQNQKIYTWINEKGNKVYSNTPKPE